MDYEENLKNYDKNRGGEDGGWKPGKGVRDVGQPYYLGLDLGSGSVGWAVTDENYNVIRKLGKDLWGVRLFNEASTAADRRTNRSRRRRIKREQERIRLLRGMFREEINKVDPLFFKRLDESFFKLEDKKFGEGKTKSKDSLFADAKYSDREFFKDYPTIWHLRKAIVCSSPEFKCTGEDERDLEKKSVCARKKLDVRLYYLAIQHILKRRGHFLYSGEKISTEKGLADAITDLNSEDGIVREMFGLRIKDGAEKELAEELAKHGSKSDKKKAIASLFVDALEDETDSEEAVPFKKRSEVVAGALVGGKVGFGEAFGVDEMGKISFDSGNLEEDLAKLEGVLGEGQFSAVAELKNVYDAANLHHLMKGKRCISEVMVENYDLHAEQLKELKEFFKDKPEHYFALFKDKSGDEEDKKDTKPKVSYCNYVNGGKVSQEELNKEILKRLDSCGYVKQEGDKFDLKDLADKGELLPKQRGQAKGAIPWQIHHEELRVILKELEKDYPSFKEEEPWEKREYNTKTKKILALHKFRRPYYVGPLKGDGRFNWNKEEIFCAVKAWNFDDVLDEKGLRGRLAEAFINGKIRECTYLKKEYVAPKDSLVYQEYLVLNELNNLRIVSEDGKSAPFDIKTKQRAFEDGFKKSENEIFDRNLTLRRLERWMKDEQMLAPGDSLSGASEEKYLPVLSTYRSFKRIFGDGFEQKFGREKIETAVKTILVLGEEKGYLKERLAEILEINKEDAERVAAIKVRDFGRMSAKFLSGVTVSFNGAEKNIIEMLQLTQENLMGLLSGRYGIKEKIEQINAEKDEARGGKAEWELDFLEDIESLYGSAAMKRTLWQAHKVVREIAEVMGRAPEKVFIETPREDNSKEAKKQKAGKAKSRYARLELAYKDAKRDKDFSEVAKELEGYSERRDELVQKRLFLYFSQNGKCAYSGEEIRLEDIVEGKGFYDIDHIFPYSLSQDDSLERNMVLVKAELNREKSNKTLPAETVAARKKMWESWQKYGLISKEKLNRLLKGGEMSEDEMGGFIARQIVETGQSARLARDMLRKMFPEAKVVLSKAGQVSRLRQVYSGRMNEDEDTKVFPKERYEFIKIRELNNLHHAKDAYLNIVVGNVMNSTFSGNPREWVRKKREEDKEYTISEKRLFRLEEEYWVKNRDDDGKHLTKWPEVKGWKFRESFEIVSGRMKRNGVLVSRRTGEKGGQFSDTQIVGAGKKKGMLPVKRSDERLNPDKYGGFNSVNNAFFTLIEVDGKRKIVGVPIIWKDRVREYVAKKFSGVVVREKIYFGSMVEYKKKEGGRSVRILIPSTENLSQNKVVPVKEISLDLGDVRLLKIVLKFDEVSEDKVAERLEKREVNEADLTMLFNSLLEKLELFNGVPTLGGKVDEIVKSGREKFETLTLADKISAILELQKIICDRSGVDNELKVLDAGKFGRATIGNGIDGVEKCVLIEQSPTGLFEKRMDLLRMKPEKSSSGRVATMESED